MLKRRLKIEKWKIRMGDTPGLAYFFDLKSISGIPLGPGHSRTISSIITALAPATAAETELAEATLATAAAAIAVAPTDICTISSRSSNAAAAAIAAAGQQKCGSKGIPGA